MLPKQCVRPLTPRQQIHKPHALHTVYHDSVTLGGVAPPKPSKSTVSVQLVAQPEGGLIGFAFPRDNNCAAEMRDVVSAGRARGSGSEEGVHGDVEASEAWVV